MQFNKYKLSFQDRNLMMISTDEEKASDKNQTPFHCKSPKEIRNRRKTSQHNKGKTMVSINWWKTQITLKLKKKPRVSTFFTPIQHSIWRLIWNTKIRKEIKGIQTIKGVKASLFADDMILYITYINKFTRKLFDNKYILQSGKILNKHPKISGLPICHNQHSEGKKN